MTVEKISIKTDLKVYTLSEVPPGTWFKFSDNPVIFIKTLESIKSDYVEVFNMNHKKVERYLGKLVLGQVFTGATISLEEVRK